MVRGKQGGASNGPGLKQDLGRELLTGPCINISFIKCKSVAMPTKVWLSALLLERTSSSSEGQSCIAVVLGKEGTALSV